MECSGFDTLEIFKTNVCIHSPTLTLQIKMVVPMNFSSVAVLRVLSFAKRLAGFLILWYAKFNMVTKVIVYGKPCQDENLERS